MERGYCGLTTVPHHHILLFQMLRGDEKWALQNTKLQ